MKDLIFRQAFENDLEPFFEFEQRATAAEPPFDPTLMPDADNK